MGFVTTKEIEKITETTEIWEIENLALVMNRMIEKNQIVRGDEIELGINQYNFNEEIATILSEIIGNYYSQKELVVKMQEQILKKIKRENLTNEEISMLSRFFSKETMKALKAKEKKENDIIKLCGAVFLKPISQQGLDADVLDKFLDAVLALK